MDFCLVNIKNIQGLFDIGEEFFGIVDLDHVRFQLGQTGFIQGDLFQFFDLMGEKFQVTVAAAGQFVQ